MQLKCFNLENKAFFLLQFATMIILWCQCHFLFIQIFDITEVTIEPQIKILDFLRNGVKNRLVMKYRYTSTFITQLCQSFYFQIFSVILK